MGRFKKILIVDDEPKIRALFHRQLKGVGYHTLLAEHGKRALELLKEIKDIDLVILDIALPEISGLDIFETMKREFPGVKVIVSSVYSKDEQEFLIFDADDYYYKSDNISGLVDKVNKLLRL